MARFRKLAALPQIFYSVFFILYFLYFLLFNRYHLAYQEQIQLFLYDWNYFTGFLARPGGLSIYFGAFFSQFFIIPLAGAFIVTLEGIAICLLADYILRKYNISGILWSIIPVLLIIALNSDHRYNLGYSLGFILALTFTAIYVSIKKDYIRYTAGIIIWFFLYFVTGGFSLLAIVLFIIHELFYKKERYWFFAALGYASIAVAFPYFAWHFIFFIPVSDAWLYPVIFPFYGITKIVLIILLVYFPLLLIVIKLWFKLSKKTQLSFGWNWKTVLVGIIVLLTFSWGIKKYSYDIKTELILGIDNCVQHLKWDKALKLSSRCQGTNRLAVYFTNLALYKTGRIGDQMFRYNQYGIKGLWLDWPGNEFSVFLGGDIFYHLGYINEAYRWAFDAMVAKGQSPRLMKRLVMISLINGNSVNAEKYLNILDETLFYRKWAQHYRNYLVDNKLLLNDPEIIEKRHLLIHEDFIVSTNNISNVLSQLLKNHPDNRMAFEYYMAALLLDKDISAFAANINHIKDLGYKEIPVHYEEALLVYMSYAKNNIVPEGYLIRKSTFQRFSEYSNAYTSYSGNADMAAQNLKKRFGNTYWFYLHFINTQVKIR
jgi:MFS family permease